MRLNNIPFKPQAYELAAFTLENLQEPVEEIYKRGGIEALKDLPGIGESIAKKIIEYLETGSVRYYLEIKRRLPVDLSELTRVEGMGPKRAKILYEKLGVRTLEDLERVAKEGKIASLPGFGEKSQENILEAIEFLKRSKGRFLLNEVWPLAELLLKRLRSLKEVERVEIAGSLRRRKETIGDLDILVISSCPKKVADFFVNMPEVVKIWGKGETRSSVRLDLGIDVDLRLIPPDSFGAALQYFTGSKAHNIALRKIAQEQGLKLNEYGLFDKKGKKIAGKTEQEIYNALGFPYIEPELRENRGELETAKKGELPKLVSISDIKGDLHCHSNWDGGQNSILELVNKALSLGYEYIGIADHTRFLRIEHGLGPKELEAQRKEIERINTQLKKQGQSFKVLQGCEANIMRDGSLDLPDSTLKNLDYVIAGVHSHFKLSEEEMTQRILKALENPYLTILAHPTGRLLKRRPSYVVDMEKVMDKAKEKGKVLEIDAFPERLDLPDTLIKMAIEKGVKLVINTDTHEIDHMEFMRFGVWQARRGWAEKNDIINTLSLPELESFLQKNRA